MNIGYCIRHADVVLASPHYYHHIIKLEIAPVPLFRQLTALHALVIHISVSKLAPNSMNAYAFFI